MLPCQFSLQEFLRTMTSQPVTWSMIKDKDVHLDFHILAFKQQETV